MNEDEVEARVIDDNNSQRRWIEVMKPRKSMLKFRCSYRPGKTEYFDGDIQLPVWGPVTTTETRLIPFDNYTAIKTYDHTTYEEQMFYFNTKTRMTWYPHNIKADGLCHCFDCRSEVFILSEYLSRVEKRIFASDDERDKAIAYISEEISSSLGSPLSLYTHRVYANNDVHCDEGSHL